MHSTVDINAYQKQGAYLAKGLFTEQDIAAVTRQLHGKICDYFDCQNAQDQAWVNYAIEHPEIVTQLYDSIQNLSAVVKLGTSEPLKSLVQTILGNQAQLYSKIPFRIDVPGVTKELAYWHQDDFYVQGAPNELTVWVPLQDTPAHLGALSVMLNSHHAGKIPHTIAWGKKKLPQHVFDAPINIVEMCFGDALLFSSFTLHSSNLNLSRQIRYSLQFRYTTTELGQPSKIMGALYDL